MIARLLADVEPQHPPDVDARFAIHRVAPPAEEPWFMTFDCIRNDRIEVPDSVVRRTRAFEVARRELPGVDLSFDEFRRHLAALGYEAELPQHVTAVYLCAACALQRPAALGLLEREYFPALRRWVARFEVGPDVLDDVLQTVRERLLLEPKLRIATYRGKGPLGAWLRVITTNVLRDRSRWQRAHATLDAEIHPLAESFRWQESPESASSAQHSAEVLNQALVRSIRVLPLEQRRLLQLRFIDSLSIDDMAPTLGVHRATVARLIQRSVDLLAKAVRRQLAALQPALEHSDWQEAIPALCWHSTLDLEALLALRDDLGGAG